MSRRLSALGALWLVLGCADPGQAELARGNLLASQRKLDAAAQAYGEAAARLPGKARPLELLGHVLFDLGRYPEAQTAYTKALAAEPEAALEAQLGLARLEGGRGESASALQRLDGLLAQDPNNLYARLSRAHLALRRGEEADAARALEDSLAALALSPHSPAALYTRGCALLAQGQAQAAQEAFAALALSHPASPLAPYGQARVAAARSARADVILALRQARQKARPQPGAWRPDEVRADPAFQFIKDDPEFQTELSN